MAKNLNKDNFGGGFKYKQTVAGQINPLRDNVIVQDMEFGIQTTNKGLIMLNDDGANHGIKPRWGKVHSVGPEQTEIKVGDYILVSHGRWTRGIELENESGVVTIRMVDNADILAVSDTPMQNGIGQKTGSGNPDRN
jgi:co-chaperonin GroES (HSP10)